MRHVDEAALQAYRDDELPPASRAEVDAHLGVCARCAADLAHLAELASRLSGALALVDVVPPMLPARQRIRAEHRRRSVLERTAVLRRAAVFLLVSAAAVSATVIPGSPVRGWFEDSWRAGSPEPLAEPMVAVAERTAAAEQPAGVSLRPDVAVVRIVVSEPAAGLRLQVRMHDGERLGVWATGAAANARFHTARDRIEVVAPGAGQLDVEVPRTAQSVILEVDGRAYMEKRGDQLRFPGPDAERVGPEIRFEVVP